MAKLEIFDQRQTTLMKMDPDQSEGFKVWIQAFLADLENRYRGLGVKADIEMKITMVDR